MELKYLFEAEKLYQSRRFKACLNLLYEHSCFAKWLNWTLIVTSLLLSFLSLWLSIEQHTASAAVAAAAIAAVAVATAAAVSGGAATAVAIAAAAATFAISAFVVVSVALFFSRWGVCLLCRIILRHEQISEVIKKVRK